MHIVFLVVSGVDFDRCILRDVGILWLCLGALDVSDL